MQESVSLIRYKNKPKLNLKIIVAICLGVMFGGVIILSFYIKNRQIDVFKQQSFYYVYAYKSKKAKTLEKYQDLLKETGGAGKICRFEDNYYLIINVYLSEEFAQSVVSKNLDQYIDCGVIEVKSKSFSKISKNKLKRDEVLVSMIKNLNNDIFKLESFMIEYLNEKVSDNHLCSQILKMQFDLDYLKNSSISADEDGRTDLSIIASYLDLELVYYSNFINDFLYSSKKSSVLCEFFVDLTLLKLDFFNNL